MIMFSIVHLAYGDRFCQYLQTFATWQKYIVFGSKNENKKNLKKVVSITHIHALTNTN